MITRNLSHKEVSRLGGKSTYEKYGVKFMSKNGKKGVATLRKLHGPDYFKKLAAAGLAARIEKSKSIKSLNNN